ncbi:hypothetical protein ABZ464_50335 [Streptomyces sp. NPDC005820]|uniref:hypothetical protein n=1 Tax=Streptomyces sp. NPDC005820 TaxID=3157069 RepID=UPI0033DA6BBF
MLLMHLTNWVQEATKAVTDPDRCDSASLEDVLNEVNGVVFEIEMETESEPLGPEAEQLLVAAELMTRGPRDTPAVMRRRRCGVRVPRPEGQQPVDLGLPVRPEPEGRSRVARRRSGGPRGAAAGRAYRCQVMESLTASRDAKTAMSAKPRNMPNQARHGRRVPRPSASVESTTAVGPSTRFPTSSPVRPNMKDATAMPSVSLTPTFLVPFEASPFEAFPKRAFPIGSCGVGSFESLHVWAGDGRLAVSGMGSTPFSVR